MSISTTPGLYSGNKSSAPRASPHPPARGKTGERLIRPARIEAAAVVGEGAISGCGPNSALPPLTPFV